MERFTDGRLEVRRGRVTRLAEVMVNLYINDWRAPQSPEYEATRAEYLQALTDAEYPDLADGTHSHFTVG